MRKNLIDKALRHIEAHLREPLTLEDVATVANYSPWHFHRLFYASTGITLGEYIRKRRLSEASRELVQSGKPIKQLAAEYCFESQAAFTRSLKSYCGCTPGRLRAQVRSLICYQPVLRFNQQGAIMQTPKITHKEAFRVAGRSCLSTMNDNVIPKLWDDFSRFCRRINSPLTDGTALGVCFYEEMEDMSGETPFRYLAGMEVDPAKKQPEDLEIRDVPASDYAVFEHHGSLETLCDTYSSVYTDWLPQSGYQRKKADDFELYDQRFVFGQPESVMEIWVPIEK